MRVRFMSALALCALLLSFVGAGRTVVFSQARTAASGIGYANVRVRGKRIMYPRLTRFRDAAVMREVNRQIDAATREFGCGGQGGKDASFEIRSKVTYARNDIFSIYASAQYWCGGPYPTNDANMSQTFDMRTGKLVEFTGLFKNYEADREAILKTIFAQKIAAAERLKASGKATDDSCESPYELDNLQSSSFAFNFSRTGLQVQPQWPHVIEACADIVTVPYSKLQKFAAPDGLLARAK